MGLISLRAAPPVSGPGSSAQPIAPTLSADGTPTDITQYLVADQYLNLADGNYIVRIPADGSLPVAKDANYALTRHFVDNNTPTIYYSGIITGSGTIRITTTTPYATNPKGVYGYTNITGGCLSFKFFQPFAAKNLSQYVDAGGDYKFVPGQPDLATFIVDPNVALGYTWISSPPVNRMIAPGAPPTANPGGQAAGGYNFANIVNNGLIVGLASAYCGWGSITGTGIIHLENIEGTSNVNDQPGIPLLHGDNHLNGARYSAYVAVASGAWTGGRGQYQPQMPFAATFIWNYEAGALINGDIYEFGNDSFYNATLTGRYFPGGFSPSPIDLMPGNLTQKFNYVYNVPLGWAGRRVMYMRGNTYLGNGQALVDYGDGSTSFFIQGNENNNLMVFGQFESIPQVPSDAQRFQNLYFNYSGTYSFNGSIDLYLDNTGRLAGPLNTDHYGANFRVMNPGAGKKSNYVVVTQPMFYQGVTTVDDNAVLQLGDGTVGNDSIYPVTVLGKSYPAARYSSSNGNGMILTRANASASYPWMVANQIRNSGKLIVNNTPDAQAILKAVPELVNVLGANLLDNVTGVGSLEQRGRLPLTLGDTTYTGQTIIGADSTLLLLTNPGFSIPNGAVPLVTPVYGSIQFSSGVFLKAAGAVFDISKGGDQLIQDLIGDVTADAATGWGPSAGAQVLLGGNALTLGSDRSTQYDGVIADGGAQGGAGGRIVKQGTGTLTLTGTSTYTGGTTINQGVLALGGTASLGAGSVTNTGGVLTTAATLVREAPVTVAEQITQGIYKAPVYTTTYLLSSMAGTFRAPRINGNYTQGAGGTLLLRLDASGRDLLTVTGTATMAGTLQVNVTDDTPAGTYNVVQAGALNVNALVKTTNSGRVTFNTAAAGVIKVVVTATAPALVTPSAPTRLAAVAGAAKVNLSWVPSAGVVTDYRIYRATAGGAFAPLATVQTTGWTDTTVTSGTAYAYQVTALNKTLESAASNSVSVTPQVQSPAPLGLTATAGDGQVTLTWSSVPNGTVFTQYAVLRSLAGQPFQQIAAVDKTSLGYVDTSVANGAAYQYAVVTLNQGVPGAVTYLVTTTPAFASTAPVGLAAAPVDSTQSIIVSWSLSASNNATGYQVLRSTLPDTGFQVVAPLVQPATPRTTFTDTGAINGLTYYYRVVPYNNTVPGAVATISAFAPPAAPALQSDQPIGNAITLNWTTPPGNYDFFTVLRAEAVLDATGKDTGPSAYAVLPAGASVQGGVPSGVAVSFTDTTVVQGKHYYYKVYATLNGVKGPLGIGYIVYDGRFGKPQPVDFYYGTALPLPGAPVLVSAQADVSSVTLTWTAPTAGAPVSRYVVKRSSAQGGPYTVVNNYAWFIGNTTFAYVDQGVESQKQYYYVLTAYNGSIPPALWTSDPGLMKNEANFGPDSNELTASTVAADAPGTPTLVSAVAVPPPSGQATTAINLTWTPPSAVTAGNVTGYEVYRSNTPGTGFTKIAGVSGTDTFTYADIVTIGSPLYYYRVAAVNGDILGIVSNELSAITAPGPVNGFTAVAGDGYVNLSWIQPNSQRVGALTDFFVQRTNGTTQAGFSLVYGVTPGFSLKDNGAAGLTFSFKDTSIANGTAYTYIVAARNVTSASLPSSALTVNPQLTPTAVGGVSGLGVSGQAEINLSWTPSSNTGSYTGAAAYRVERSTAANGSFTVLAGALNATGFVDTTVAFGTTYYYRITPLDGIIAGPSLTSAGIQSAPNPPALVTLTGVNGQTALQLNWQAPLAGSWSSFTLQLFDAPGASVPVFTAPAIASNGTIYVINQGVFPGLKNGATYYATLFANYGSVQSTVPAPDVASTQPNSVTNFIAAPGNAQVRLGWTPPSVGNCTGFNVSRALRTGNTTGTFSVIAQGATASSYTDNGLTNGQAYVYFVTPLNGVVLGQASNQLIVQPNAVPPVVTTLTATPSEGAFTLNWAAPAGFLAMTSGPLNFAVGVSTSPGGPYASYASRINANVSVTAYSARYTTLPDGTAFVNGQTYYWAIYAFNGAVSSDASNEVSAATNLAPAAPTDLAAQAFDGGVQLGWSAPPAAAKPAATGYQIYRGTAFGTYTLIATIGSATAYVDTGAVDSTAGAATPYYYQVVALNGQVPGPASAPEAAMPPGVTAPWLNADVGAVFIPGSADQIGGTFTIVASGADIRGVADQFHFVYQPIVAAAGDCTVVARVVGSGDAVANKAGVMIRESLDPAARYFTVYENNTASGAAQSVLQARSLTGGAQSVPASATGGYPYWVKLVRRSNVFTAYSSANGADWTQIGAPQTVADFAVNAFLGLIHTARSNNVTDTATFDNVTVLQGQIPADMGLVTAQGQLGAGNTLQVRLDWQPVIGATGYRITRAPVSGGTFATIATGVLDSFYVDGGLAAGTPYFYKVVPVGLGGEGGASGQVVAIPPGVVAPWQDLDLGQFTFTGAAGQSAPGAFTLIGDGSGSLDRYSEGLHFVHQAVAGDATLVARVVSQGISQPAGGALTAAGGRAGVMIREANTDRARSFVLAATPAGTIQAITRLTPPGANAPVTVNGAALTLPYWMKLTRAGDAFTLSYSLTGADGSWTTVLQQTSTGFSANAYLGLMTTSGAKGILQAATFDNVSLTSTVIPQTSPVLAAPTTALGQANLSWSAVSGAASYTIQQSANGGGFTTLASVTGTTYAATGLAAGTTYAFRVAAANSAGSGAYSNTVTAVPPSALVAPVLALAVGGSTSTQVNLSWNTIANATSYTLRRTAAAGAATVTLASGLTGTSYVDTATTANPLVAGSIYYYEVIAITAGTSSAASNRLTVALPPDAPAGLTTAGFSGSGQVRLHWLQPVGSLVSTYTVQRSVSADTGFVNVAGGSGLAATTFTDTTSALGSTYYYRVFALSGSSRGIASNPASQTTSPNAVTAVSAVSAINSSSQSGVTVTWSAPAGVVGSYSVVRGIVSGGPYDTVVASGLTTRTVTDSSVANNGTYYYTVIAANGSLNSIGNAQAKVFTAPSPVLAVNATGIDGVIRIDLNWTAVTGATGYTLQRSLSAASGFSAVTGATALSTAGFSDTTVSPGTTYYYRVIALNNAASGNPSLVVSVVTAPRPASQLAALNNNGVIALAWTAPSGQVTGYNVRRGTASGGPYDIIVASGLTATNYADSSTAAGTAYYYVVTSLNGPVAGAISNEAVASVVPNAPQSLTAAGVRTINRVDLTWLAPSAGAFSGFTVQRAESAAGPFAALAAGTNLTFPGVGANSGTRLAFSDTTVGNSRTYYYQVVALGGATVSAPAGPVAATTAPAQVGGLTAAAADGTPSVTLNWTALPDGSFAGYVIRRAINTGANTPDTAVYSTYYPGGNKTYTATTFTETVAAGTAYFYKVYAYAAFATGTIDGADSAVATVAGAPAVTPNLTAAVANGPVASVTLTWAAPASGAFTSFTVQRSDGGTVFATIADALSPTTLAYTDATLALNSAYTYRVFAKNGTVAGTAAQLTAATASTPPLGLTATQIAGQAFVTLNWLPPAAGTYTYALQRSDSQNGTYTTIQTGLRSPLAIDPVTGTSTSWYQVLAFVGTAASAPSGKATTLAYPAAITNLAATPATSVQTTVTLAWSLPVGTYGNIVVRRSLSSTQNYSDLATLPATAAGYVDSTTGFGTTYFYKVMAKDPNGLAADSNIASALTVPGAPLKLTAGFINGAGRPQLSWQAPGGSVSTYALLRGTTAGQETTIVNGSYANGNPVVTYSDNTVGPGTTYYYVVSAQNATGSGPTSNEAATVTITSAPAQLLATAANAAVSLQWTAVPGGNGCNINRSTSFSGPFAKVGAVANGVTAYTDTTVQNQSGSKPAVYYYTVTALAADGVTESPASNRAAGLPPGLGAPWTVSQDIPLAPTFIPGAANLVDGTLTVVAAGTDIGGTADGVQYTAQPVDTTLSRFSLVTHLAGFATGDRYSKAGVMFRETLAANSRQVALYRMPSNGTTELATRQTAAAATTFETSTADDDWLKITGIRTTAGGAPAAVLTAWTSPDGVNWTPLGTPKTFASLPATAYVGLVTCSRNQYVVATATYDRTALYKGDPPPAPAGFVVTPASQQAALKWNAVTGASGYIVRRSNTPGGFYTALATGLTDTAYTDTGLVDGNDYFYTVTAFNATSGEGVPSLVTSVIPPGVSSPWSYQDIGTLGATVTIAGSSGILSGRWAQGGEGAGIGSTSDALQYVSQPLPPYGAIQARVLSQSAATAGAEAGVMIRETLAPDSACMGVFFAAAQGLQSVSRLTPGGIAVTVANPAGGLALPYWVRVVRQGNVLTSYAAPDNSGAPGTWTQLDTRTLSLAPGVYAGLAATGGGLGAYNAAVYDNVALAPLAAPALAAPVFASGQLQLSWTPVAGATGYVIKQNFNGSTVLLTGDSGASITATLNTFTQSGTYSYQVAALNTVGSGPYSNNREVALTATATPFQQWLVQQGMPVTTAGSATASGDGVPLLLKYATHMPALTPAANPVTVLSAGNGLTLAFTRLAPATVTYIVETSTDLKTWTAAAALQTGGGSWTTSGASVNETNAGSTTSVAVTITAPSLMASPRLFVRLRVTGS